MIKRMLLMLGLAVVGTIIGFFALIYFFVGSMCGESQIGKYISPNLKHEVTYYRRDCGAMDSGAFNIDLNGTTLLRAYSFSTNPYTVTWTDDQHIFIGTAASTTGVRIYKIRDKYRDIDVTYDDKIKNGVRVR
jgi:hypothetical protein